MQKSGTPDFATSCSAYLMSPEEIRVKLRRLYVHYSCVGTRSKITKLTSAKLLRLLLDAQLTNQLISRSQLEIVIASHTKKNTAITFQLFCQILQRISRMLYEDQNLTLSPVDQLYKMLDQKILPLYEKLAQTTDIEQFEKEDFSVDEDCYVLLERYLPVLMQIYNSNFPWELGSSDVEEVVERQSEQAFQRVMLRYGITPDVVTHIVLYRIWQNLMVAKEHSTIEDFLQFEDYGSVFSLKKFVVSLLRIALLGDFGREVDSSSERLHLLIERMEMSDGFVSPQNLVVRSANTTNGLKSSCKSPNPKMSTQKLSEILQNVRSDNESRMHNSSTSKFESPSKGSDQSYEAETVEKVDQYLAVLEELFKGYCQDNDTQYTRKLSLTKFIHMMQNAGLIVLQKPGKRRVQRLQKPLEDILPHVRGSPISRQEFELIFAKQVRQNAPKYDNTPQFRKLNHQSPKPNDYKRIDFSQFLRALEDVALKIFPDVDLNDSYGYLIGNYIIPLQTRFNNQVTLEVQQALSQVQRQDFQTILASIRQTINPYFRAYKDKQGMINFYNFIKFCKDFEIFPSVLAKNKLVQVFSVVYSNLNNQKPSLSPRQIELDQSDTDNLNFQQFTIAIAICAILGNLPEKTHQERICSLMERICQSEGPSLIPRTTGLTRGSDLEKSDFLLHFREQYEGSMSSRTEMTFDDLLESRPLAKNQ